MINRLKVTLDQSEYSVLLKLALSELRTPSDHLRHIFRIELQRCGLLPKPEDQIIENQMNEGTTK